MFDGFSKIITLRCVILNVCTGNNEDDSKELKALSFPH